MSDVNNNRGWQSALIDLSFEPIFAWDWDEGIIEWNSGAEIQYGYARDEVLGKNSHELLATKHPVSLRRFQKKLAADGHWVGEVRHTTRDGRELVIESRQQIILQDGRRIVVESNRDITERREGEGQRALLIIIGDLIRKINNPDELLYAASKAVGVHFSAKRCLFNEIDQKNDLEIIHRDYCQKVRSVAGRHKLSAYSSITSKEMSAGQTVFNADSKIDPRTSKFYKKTYEPAGERAYVAVPMMRDGEWKASLWLSDDKPREWSKSEVTLLEVVAERVWLAVEKLRNEEALRKSLEFDEAVMRNMSEGLYTVNSEGLLMTMNLAAEKLFGWTIEELRGRKMHDVTHHHYRDGRPFPSEECAGFRVLQQGVPITNQQDVFIRKDGTFFDVVYSSSPLRDAAGKILGLVVVFNDMTESIRANEALRESEESYRVLAESASDAIISIDENSKIGFVNTAATRIFGYTDKEMAGQSLTMLMPENLREQHRAGFGRYLKSGVRKLNWESVQITARHKDGRHFPIEISFGEYDRGGMRFFIGIARDITERKKAIEDLRESESRRQLAQDAGNIGIFEWDIPADKTYWSETMWSFYGENRRDINPDDAFWSAHLHNDDRYRVKRNLQQVLSTGGIEFRDEFRIVRSDGTIRWIEARARVSRDEAGNAMRLYGVNNDITLRKVAEEKIRASENQLRLVTRSVPALISYVDKNERYRFANERFTDWFGVPTDKIIGKRPRDIFGAAAYTVLKPWIDKVLSGKKCTFETVLKYKQIGDRYVSVSYIPDIGAGGEVYGYYGLTHDLTEFKRSEDLLRSSEERNSLMMESLADYAIFFFDGDGAINSWNRGAELIFGYTPDEILGRSHEILYTLEDVAVKVPQKEMGVARRKSRSSDERWLLRKDGSRFFANSVTMPLQVGKTLTGYARIVSDLTEKKRHAEELQQAHDELEIRVKERTNELAESNTALVQEMREREIAEKQRIELLGRLVTSQESERRRFALDLHDQMGQRLTALRLKIASLHELSPGDEQFTQRVNRLQEIAERLDSEVSFLSWELRPAALDDLGLLDSIKTFVDEWTRHHDIAADFHSAGLSGQRLDREVETHLYRVTQEALNNVAKHADAKQVTVMLERMEQSVILIIEDDGKGFDAPDKLASSESDKTLGLVGMGERATLIGGEIEIESSPGKGTTIFVRVPFSN